ncbi:MAG: PmoA family protein [Planctomycetia bacterium]|nr:PmoA family protein [Planctomycetia bacterium]
MSLYAQSQGDASDCAVELQLLEDNRARIYLDGEFFAEYRPDHKGTPTVWPLRAPNGALVTRAWPMVADLSEEELSDPTLKETYANAQISERGGVQDHRHHRSLWFNHGDVSGGDFWGGTGSVIRQSRLLSARVEGSTVVIETENFWRHEKLDRDICKDIRTLRFGRLAIGKPANFIDYAIEIEALEDNVFFGDTKEGSFGVRVPSAMAVTSKKLHPTWGGRIENDLGSVDAQTWSEKAHWVNYVGPVEKYLTGEELARELAKDAKSWDYPLTTAGVAIINGPNSLNQTPWSHVRDYGLFAINPFGQNDFEPKTPGSGTRKLSKGDTLQFSFRVILHNGDLSASELDAQLEAFNPAQ